MRFYPISYHQFEDKQGVGIIIFAYKENGEHVAIRLRYTYWFYVNMDNHSYEQLQEIIEHVSGVHLDPEKKQEERRSTKRPHDITRVIRIHADNFRIKQDLMRLFDGNNIEIYEENNILSPVLKMITEENIKKHQWLEVETAIPHDIITKMPYEYVGKIETLRSCRDEKGDLIVLPPPNFTFLSYDGEMDSDNWNKIPDAGSSKMNAIRVLAFTYGNCPSYMYSPTQKRIYKEYLLVLGPDVTDIFKQYRAKDIESGILEIYTFTSELALILKIFDMIIELDPDVLAGHNIINFDNKYILERYQLLAMWSLTKGNESNGVKTTTKIPNISRLVTHNMSTKTIQWSNSQVAIDGIYFDAPGRIWIDTLVVAGRSFLGQLKNNKLDTIGEQLLGMNKDEIHYKDMFKAFKLYRDHQSSNKSSVSVRETYETMLRMQNKSIPKNIKKPEIKHINNLIKMINGMSQREKKISLLTMKDALDKAKEKKISLTTYLSDEFKMMREKCIILIKEWNIPIVPKEQITEKEMISIMWWLIGSYCIQYTRIPYQVMDQDLSPLFYVSKQVYSP